jgi:rSAM/selenodomain-associated transferase 1
VVYVMAKAPRAGAAKTRLCPPLDLDRAAALAEAFLRDTIASVLSVGCEARVMCRNAREQVHLRRLVGNGARVDVQAGRGLGAALGSAFVQGLDGEARYVAVLGSDSPTLPPAQIDTAFAALADGADVALGPTEDGGYYLLAASALHSSLFVDMPWSTDLVAQVTLARCAAARLGTVQLAPWYDVDDAASLNRLLEELGRSPRTLAPATRAALATWEHAVPGTIRNCGLAWSL